MNKTFSTIQLYSWQPFFWDAQIEKLDFKDDYYYIIERVILRSMNFEQDFDRLSKIYEINIIKEVVQSSNNFFSKEDILRTSHALNISPSSIKNWHVFSNC